MRHSTLLASLLLLLLLSPPAFAGSHLWRINEVFSTQDGSNQFIELYECCGSTIETGLAGLELESVANETVYVFTHNVARPTDNKYLLIATPGFESLPGAPAPDYVMPAAFFSTLGDTIWYSEARNYDSFTFGEGDLPVDGVTSIQVTDWDADVFDVGVNSPTNFAGETGSIGVSAPEFVRGDCNDDGSFDIGDPVSGLNWLFVGGEAPPCDDACDSNDDGAIQLSDAVRSLTKLFVSDVPLPPPAGVCGVDPTADDGLGCDAAAACLED